GGKEEGGELPKLAGIAWIFVSSALWNCTQFSTLEKQAAQKKITRYLRLSLNCRRAFLAFCERVLLAKLCLPKGPGSLTLPSVWLDRRHAKGFSETRTAYRQVKALRKSLPLYKYEWKALAEAVLDFGEDPTAENFRYWKNYFTEKQAPGLLQLFQVFASNYLFKI
ncbi:MAG TPA: hypothetical protein VF939_08990, partial [Puia sp.]